MTDLTICQECHENPAVYGDGLTWSRCSACELKNSAKEEPKDQLPPDSQGFAHEIVPGLVSIVLPVYMLNYSLFHYTGNCIGSIREHTPKDSFELIVVDNGSPIQPPNLQAYYANRVIKNEKNFGVSKAWNQGIRMGTGEYICLINNDVQVFEHWLEDMKVALDMGYDLVMAHPMYSLTEPFSRAIESKKIRDDTLAHGELYTDFIDFSCVMFKRSLVDEIGLFDEDFFVYCSDTDLIKRMEKAGKKWTCVESVPTAHISGGTGYYLKETPAIMERDKEVFRKKWEKIKEEEVKKLVDSDSIERSIERELVRSDDTGNAIYLLHNGSYYHIENPETLHALGFEFGDEKTVDAIPYDKIGAESINMENYGKYA